MNEYIKGFAKGMTISNEPGYYEDNEFGIRIENICVTVDVNTANNFNNKQFLGFETISFAPIKTDLINVNLLTTSEIEWINNYNQQVYENLHELMESTFPQTLPYLIEETKPISRSQ